MHRAQTIGSLILKQGLDGDRKYDHGVRVEDDILDMINNRNISRELKSVSVDISENFKNE